MTPQAGFALLFGAQFAAIGVMMPFLPAVLKGHGLVAEQVAAILALGSATRLLAGPLVGRAADALGDPRRVLVAAALLAGAMSTGFALVQTFAALLLVNLFYSLAMAPVIPLTDALCLGASRRVGFDYGRVRSMGSVTFILAAVAGGQVVAAAGLTAVVWLFALCLLATAIAAAMLPGIAVEAPGRVAGGGAGGGFLGPFRQRGFRRLLPVSALIQGSHALYYGFGTIHWQAAGLSPGLIGLLWAEAVVAEVALFLWGRRLADRLGAAGLAAAAAAGGALRWAVMAETTAWPLLALVQPLHGLTFGAMHLAAMRVLGRLPPDRAATAQTLHASLGVGLSMGLLTLASGPLYAGFGGAGFWAMAGLSALALPLALRLGRA